MNPQKSPKDPQKSPGNPFYLHLCAVHTLISHIVDLSAHLVVLVDSHDEGSGHVVNMDKGSLEVALEEGLQNYWLNL